MKSRFLVMSGGLVAILALAACGGGATEADADGDGKITHGEARAAMEAAGNDLKPQPGKYTTSMELVEVNIPGAPPQVVEMMGKAMNRTQEFCLTPEQADKGFEDSLKQGQSDTCTIKAFSIEGNQVDMAMACAQDGMGQMDVRMTGEVSPTGSDLNMKMNGTIPQLGAVDMSLNFKQTRLGECDS